MNMKEKFHSLNIYHQTFVVSAGISLLLFLLLIPLFFFNLGEISFGLLIGEFISYMSYFVLGIFEKKNPSDKKGLTSMVMTLIIRVIILSIILVVDGLLYYKLGIKIFNIISIACGYFIPLIIFITINMKERRSDGNI